MMNPLAQIIQDMRYFLIDKEGKIVSVYAPTPGKDFEALIDMTLQK